MPAQDANPEIAATYSDHLSSACQKVPLSDAPVNGRVSKVSVMSHAPIFASLEHILISGHAQNGAVLQNFVNFATTAFCCTCSVLQGTGCI